MAVELSAALAPTCHFFRTASLCSSRLHPESPAMPPADAPHAQTRVGHATSTPRASRIAPDLNDATAATSIDLTCSGSPSTAAGMGSGAEESFADHGAADG